MDFDELKKDIRNIEYELEYGEEQHLGKIAVDVNCLRSVIDFANEAITALQAYQPWNSISDPPLKNGKYLLYAPKFIYEGCEYSETLDIGLYHDGLGFSMPNCFPEPKATHWLEIRKPYEVEL